MDSLLLMVVVLEGIVGSERVDVSSWHEETSEDMELGGAKRFCEDVRKHASGANVVQEHTLIVNSFAKVRDAGRDVLHGLGGLVAFGEHHRRDVVAED